MNPLSTHQAIQKSFARIASGEPRATDAPHRRGYVYGFEAALRMLQEGVPLDRIREHADHLQSWREKLSREGLDGIDAPSLDEAWAMFGQNTGVPLSPPRERPRFEFDDDLDIEDENIFSEF